MAEDVSLRLENIGLKFGGLTVLDSVTLDVRSGELLALIGPNGAGKTSILNCISGVYQISSGRIEMGGTQIDGLKPHIIAGMGLARTFQNAELFPKMSVLDNLLVGRHPSFRSNALAECLFLPSVRREEKQHREAVEEVIDFVELDSYRHKLVGSLPYGLQKIVGFARALAHDPKVLLLDEPCAGLNQEGREDMARHILRIQHEKDLALIWVEHDMQMVADLADRLHVLDFGQTLAQGNPEEVLNTPDVIAAYIGHTTPAAGATVVDTEHDIQISLLRRFTVSIAAGEDKQIAEGLLDHLVDFTREHFASEELLMRLNDYPGLGAHQNEHKQMLGNLDEIRDCLNRDDCDEASHHALQIEDRLIQHIGSADQKFTHFLNTESG